jgi:hypothetical protein
MHCEVRLDADKNRLYVLLEGLLSEEEARQAANQIIAGVETLKPGGDIINDLSQFRPLSQSSLSEVRRIAEAIVKARVRRLVRIVGVSPTAVMQVQREASTVGGYESFTVSTLAQAEALLEQG